MKELNVCYESPVVTEYVYMSRESILTVSGENETMTTSSGNSMWVQNA